LAKIEEGPDFEGISRNFNMLLPLLKLPLELVIPYLYSLRKLLFIK